MRVVFKLWLGLVKIIIYINLSQKLLILHPLKVFLPQTFHVNFIPCESAAVAPYTFFGSGCEVHLLDEPLLEFLVGPGLLDPRLLSQRRQVLLKFRLPLFVVFVFGLEVACWLDPKRGLCRGLVRVSFGE